MGVLNVTPDSFSDGGLFLDPDAAVAHGLELVAQGADLVDVGGVGGTLAGNALSLAAMRATLSQVLTEAAFQVMLPLGQAWADGVAAALAAYHVPWHVTALGARAEYAFTPTPPRTGAEAAAADDFELQAYLHLHALNRGLLLTPFHNMALMAPTTSRADVDAHTAAFAEGLAELFPPPGARRT